MTANRTIGVGRVRRVLTEGFRQQRALYRLTDQLYRAQNLTEAYEATIETIVELLGCERASILRFDNKGVMRFVAEKGLSPEYKHAVTGHTPWRLGDQDPEPIFVDDIDKTEESDAIKKVIRSENIRALAFIPLTVNRMAVGKFMIYHELPHDFSEEERELALILARQLSFCIECQNANLAASRLRALIESSDDAIVAKTLDGIIQGWNRGAERLFGYGADEVIDRPITILIPEDRLDEETTILSRIKRGERVENYTTIRRRKDGSLVHVSLTVSPIVDSNGNILGASKIARDITNQHLAQERQQLLLREMNHRVKNLFAVTSSIVNLNARTATSPHELAAAVTSRLKALGRAHALTMGSANAAEESKPTLHSLAEAILGPYDQGATKRVSISGADFQLDAKSITPLALLLHEFATNASKYGSLSHPAGRVNLDFTESGEELQVLWREIGGPRPAPEGEPGFGSRLVEATVSQLGGNMKRAWRNDGLSIELSLAKSNMT